MACCGARVVLLTSGELKTFLLDTVKSLGSVAHSVLEMNKTCEPADNHAMEQTSNSGELCTHDSSAKGCENSKTRPDEKGDNNLLLGKGDCLPEQRKSAEINITCEPADSSENEQTTNSGEIGDHGSSAKESPVTKPDQEGNKNLPSSNSDCFNEQTLEPSKSAIICRGNEQTKLLTDVCDHGSSTNERLNCKTELVEDSKSTENLHEENDRRYWESKLVHYFKLGETHAYVCLFHVHNQINY